MLCLNAGSVAKLVVGGNELCETAEFLVKFSRKRT